jgi:non-specific serine/threonine protein kinase
LLGLREARAVTQEGWAALLGYGRATIQRWERGEAVPSPDAVEALVALCREEGLLRAFARGRLRGTALTAELLREILSEARAGAEGGLGPPVTGSGVSDRSATARSPIPTVGELRPLPARLSSFVGRERELDEVCELLRTTRLLTLTGAGGVGKSSLAIEAARRLAGSYPDGVALVELAALADASLVAHAIARGVGVLEHPSEPLPATLIRALARQRALLVLDNCEHLIDACARIAEELLKGADRLSVLATSREALRLPGELTWRVPSLAVPPADGAPSRPVDRERPVAEFDAVRLFSDRVAEVRPAFVLSERNAPAVAAICRRLDGIPLALEMAAAWAATLSMEQIAERLENGFGLLTRGGRTALPRYQTLRASIAWSFDLIREPERVALRRLAVFAGGFTLAAAEAVIAAPGADPSAEAPDPLDRPGVLPLIASLVEKSLVQVEGSDEDRRYSLLEAVREFALENLQAAGERAACQAQHARYYLAFAEEAEREIRGPRHLVWLDRLEADHDNVRAALRWSDSVGDAELGLRLAAAMWWFWYLRGHISEGRRLLAGALGGPGGAAPGWTPAKALDAAAWLAWGMSDRSDAERMAGAGLAAAREAGDQGLVASTLVCQGVLAMESGRDTSAQALLAEGLAVARQADDPWRTVGGLQWLALVTQRGGDATGARTLAEESLAISRTLGYDFGTSFSLQLLGHIAWRSGDLVSARAHGGESLAIRRRLNHRPLVASSLVGLGVLAVDQGDLGAATEFVREGLTIHRQLGTRGNVPLLLALGACLAAAQGRDELALILAGAAEALWDPPGAQLHPSDRARLDRWLAEPRRTLSADQQAAARQRGSVMSLAEAVDCVLEVCG